VAKKYDEIVLDDGRQARRYEDGSIRVPNGHGGWQFAVRPPYAAAEITKETASGMATRRHQLAQDRAAEGLQRAVENGMSISVAGAEDAWGRVIEKQTELAISPEEGRASTQAAKLVGVATGMTGDKKSVPVVAIQVNVSESIAARYLTDDDDTVDGDSWELDTG